jgi:hypothetical protein
MKLLIDGGQWCGRLSRRAVLLLLMPAIGLGGCSDILDVENPNDLIEDDLSDPAAAGPIVNGASATLARALGGMLGIYSTVTDEAMWIGSRDAWRELDEGDVTNRNNEFTDDAFRYIAEARWMTNEAVIRLESFDSDGTLTNRDNLARAYLYAATAQITIADMFDDFVISDRREAGAPVGPDNMDQFYDRAIEFLDKGRAITSATGNASLGTSLLALRARAKFSKAVWATLNPAGVPSDPLISDAGATADAEAALAEWGADDKYRLTLTNNDLAYAGEVSLAYNIFQRGELEIGASYGESGSPPVVNLNDPITGEADPVITAALVEFDDAFINQPITLASAREMHLIVAEAALADGDDATFNDNINAVRDLDGLPAYTGQIPAEEILVHSRRVNLFLQGRRLADMYRFGIESPEWRPTSTAASTPGTFLPVTCIEIRAHPDDFPGVEC